MSMGKLVSVAFLSQSDEKERTAADLLLFYVIRGKAEIITASGACPLDEEGLFAVNPSEAYAVKIRGGVTARIAFRHEEVYALLQGKTRFVRCHSAWAKDGAYQTIRFQARSLFSAMLEDGFGSVLFEQRSYSLLLTLLSEYSREVGDKDRKREAAQWIENSCQNAITLEDAAERFHLTPQYFSRWFTAAFGSSFLKYVSRVRCQNAERDLLETRDSILRIALERGFPNAASFTKAFSEEYGETPLQYRKTRAAKTEPGVLSVHDVEAYLELEKEEARKRVRKVFIVCGERQERLAPYWNALCNLGSLAGLADLETQNHVRRLRNALPFRQPAVSPPHAKRNKSRLFPGKSGAGLSG